MYCADSQTDCAAASRFDGRYSPIHRSNIVDDEPDWRVPRSTSALTSSPSRILVTRWHANGERAQEVRAETPADCHVVKIVLRTMNIQFQVGARIVQDGLTTPGAVHVTEPAAAVRCLFRG